VLSEMKYMKIEVTKLGYWLFEFIHVLYIGIYDKDNNNFIQIYYKDNNDFIDSLSNLN